MRRHFEFYSSKMSLRLQAAVYIKNSYHCTLTKRLWREKQNLWRSCKKLTILLHELPVSLHTHNTEFQVLARQLTNHEQVKRKYTSQGKNI